MPKMHYLSGPDPIDDFQNSVLNTQIHYFPFKSSEDHYYYEILTFVPDLCGVLHPSIFLSEILAFLRSIGPNTNPALRHTHSPNWVDGECVLHSGFGYRTVFGRLLSLFASKVSYQHQNACTLHTILNFNFCSKFQF